MSLHLPLIRGRVEGGLRGRPVKVNRGNRALPLNPVGTSAGHDRGWSQRRVSWPCSVRQLIADSPDDLGLFLQGMSVLPLEPGALAVLTVANFDARLSTLLIGKDKASQDRGIKLPLVTTSFLAKQCKAKSKEASLFCRADSSAWTQDAWKKPVKAAALAAKLLEATKAYAL